MKRQWATSDGFTVLEILVSVVVIAILAIVTIVSYDGIQQRSRDATRESHITQIKVALEKYYAENSEYPDACNGDEVVCPATNLAPFLSEYELTVPSDPSFDGTSADYQYVRGDPGNRFGLRVSYEARPDCKDGVNIDALWWGTTLPSC